MLFKPGQRRKFGSRLAIYSGKTKTCSKCWSNTPELDEPNEDERCKEKDDEMKNKYILRIHLLAREAQLKKEMMRQYYQKLGRRRKTRPWTDLE
ncbi:hypothetical protein HN011_002452 [Eciton burchellii]|nr:hypothetical protein HN011_002452 [Eciton burchellii]